MVGVTGSNPVTPTIVPWIFKGFSERRQLYPQAQWRPIGAQLARNLADDLRVPGVDGSDRISAIIRLIRRLDEIDSRCALQPMTDHDADPVHAQPFLKVAMHS